MELSAQAFDQEWMQTFMRSTFDRCLAISKAKSNDYAGKERPFKNFALVSQLGLCPTETGILVRISDKIARLATLIQKPDQRSVVDETIQDTIDDAINYLAILGAYLSMQKERGDLPDAITVPSSRCHGFFAIKFAEAAMKEACGDAVDVPTQKEGTNDAGL